MDPLETLRLACRDATDRRWAGARTYLGFYTEWRGKGGFEPTTPSGVKGDQFAAELRRACNTRDHADVPVF